MDFVRIRTNWLLTGLFFLLSLTLMAEVKESYRKLLRGVMLLGVFWVAHRSLPRRNESIGEPEVTESCNQETELLSLIPDAVIALDASESIVFLNPAARDRLGLENLSLDRPSFKTIQQEGKMLEEMSSLLETELIKTTLIGMNSTPWAVELHLRTLDEHPLFRYVATLRTREDCRSTETPAELDFNFYQAQKMEAVGLLAGGVAHDFNNLLAVIGGSAEDLADDGDRGETLLRINQAVSRAKTTTDHLLTFSRRHLNASESIQLGEIFNHTMTKVSRVLPRGLKLKWTREPKDYRVFLNREHAVSFLQDLLLNARDAIAQEGEIVANLSGHKLVQPKPWAGGTIPPGDYAQITVADSGCGMTKEIQDRVFEPFFTTKSDDLRSGFGLASVYGIVKAAGGGIFIESEIGIGTHVQVLIPIQSTISSASTKSVRRATSEKPKPHEARRVALVEDEPSLRTLLERTLSRSGYQVESAANGADALDAFLSRAGEFDILITDVVMPRMRGPALARKLKEANPNLRVVFMSGYTDGALAEIDLDTDLFLQKPFCPNHFLLTLEEL